MAGRNRRREKQDAVSRDEEYLRGEGKIRVRICGRENGLEEYNKINFVRVKSKRYNLLIMADYMPMIGELEGSVFFRNNEKEYMRDNLRGYFMHKNNEFSLMLEEEGNADNGKKAEEEEA